MHASSSEPTGPVSELVPLGEGDLPSASLRDRVRAALEGGDLVALPTETVYGIAARADDPDALAALGSLKGRGQESPFTWHTSPERALRSGCELLPLLRRLAERYWPGPLTLVLRGAPSEAALLERDGWTGVRQVAHAGTRALIEELDFPVVLSSANGSGEEPLCDAEAIRERFPRGLALIVDGGGTRMREASAVLAVGPGRFELLREGLLPIDDLRRTAGLRIVFACTGNTCRSPMAEGLARKLLAERLAAPGAPPADLADFGFGVCSIGILAGSGSPAAAHAIEVMGERGIDLSAHRSQPAHPETLMRSDRIYGLTGSHVHALRQALPPSHADRVALLDPTGADIPDPIGGSRADYAACAAAIERAILARAKDWA
ncbi:MAG TPA: hypothetical protein ENJ09_08095 [Planctomycetes bacterium]|nr:hypothetical protein [Planctomycetota bacterium]